MYKKNNCWTSGNSLPSKYLEKVPLCPIQSKHMDEPVAGEGYLIESNVEEFPKIKTTCLCQINFHRSARIGIRKVHIPRKVFVVVPRWCRWWRMRKKNKERQWGARAGQDKNAQELCLAQSFNLKLIPACCHSRGGTSFPFTSDMTIVIFLLRSVASGWIAFSRLAQIGFLILENETKLVVLRTILRACTRIFRVTKNGKLL